METCEACAKPFATPNGDESIRNKLSPRIGELPLDLPKSRFCPPCRRLHRLVWRNERNLYRRDCGLCNRPTVTAYDEDGSFTVYCQECWWSDNWDPYEYGREIDFSRPFFDQFKELQAAVPRLALMNRDHQNSEYCNYAGRNKDCYLAVGGSWDSENCLYGTRFLFSRDSMDCCFIRDCELCYEVVWGTELYNCAFLLQSYHSSDCFFSVNLRGCNHCLLCSNLRNASYQIRNKPVSKEEFEAAVQVLSQLEDLQKLKAEYLELARTTSQPMSVFVNSDDCSGEYLTNCKGLREAFMASNVEDGTNLFLCDDSKDIYNCDCTGYDGTELFYETVNAGIGGHSNFFSSANWSCNNIFYCDTIMSSNNCFGCTNLKRGEYSILNKRYSQPEFEELAQKLYRHMCETGEWGRFFPPELSPFAYNESITQEFFPKPKDEVLKQGFHWKGFESKSTDNPDLAHCDQCDAPFRMIKPEQQLYQRLRVAPPRSCPDCRHIGRLALMRPWELGERKCDSCGDNQVTSLFQTGSVQCLCDKCYLKSVY